MIYGTQASAKRMRPGRGRMVLRGKSHIEEDPKTGRETIVVHGDPLPGTNKAVQLVKGVADLVNEKRIEGISDVNDYSDRTASAWPTT
jgi:DNA gyrase subunit A